MTQEPCLQFDNTIWLNPETGLLEVKRKPDGGVEASSSLRIDPDSLTVTCEYFTPQLIVGGSTVTTQGNGVFSGMYIQNDDIVYFFANFVFGTTTSFGATGNLGVLLPVVPAIRTALPEFGFNSFPISGTAHLWDNSLTTEVTYAMAGAKNMTSGYCVGEARNYAGTSLSSSVPWAWATNDIIGFCGHYRAA